MKYDKLEKWEIQQLKQMEKAIGPTVELTETEESILRWLAGWDTRTVDAVCSIIEKVRTQK